MTGVQTCALPISTNGGPVNGTSNDGYPNATASINVTASNDGYPNATASNDGYPNTTASSNVTASNDGYPNVTASSTNIRIIGVPEEEDFQGGEVEAGRPTEVDVLGAGAGGAGLLALVLG